MPDLANDFLNPAAEFSPIPFWFWNDRLTHEEIKRQIHDFFEKGVMGFVLHPRLGIPKEIGYLSDTFMEFVITAVREADQRGMKVILYDEGMYPSGSANGQVVKTNPEFASRGLKMVEYPWEGTPEISISLEEDEKLVSVQAIEKLSSNQINYQNIKILPFHEAKVHFTPPSPGNWSVVSFIETKTGGTIRGIHYGEDDGEANAPASADLLNPAAVETFIQLTHERYYHVLSQYFGTTITAIFTDEPDILGRGADRNLKPWTIEFLSYFLNEGNNENDLPLLWFEAGNHTETIRKKYQAAVYKRLANTYYRALSTWCEDHGIALTGHPEKSNDIGLLDYFQIPGQDVVWRWVAPEEEKGIVGEHSTAGKCSADAARHRGRRRNLNEVLGVCGIDNSWYLTGGDMKWYFDWLFVRGVNVISPHAFYYSIAGKARSHERPPDVGRNNIWWPYYNQFSTYIKRLSWLMTDSVNQAQVAVLCEESFLPWKITKPLYEHQIEFNYLEESLLQKCQVRQSKIHIEQQQYQVLLLEDTITLNEETKKIIEGFIEQGVTVLFLKERKQAPSFRGGIAVDSLDKVHTMIRKYLKKQVSLVPSEADVRLSHVVKDQHNFYLLVNEGETAYNGALFIDEQQSVEKWDPWRGTIENYPIKLTKEGIEIPFQLERRESIIFHLSPANCIFLHKNETNEQKKTIRLRDEWEIRVDGRLLDNTKLGSWANWEGMEYYSGSIIYEQTFELEENHWKKATLNLGVVHELAQVWMNDEANGIKMWAPYSFDLTQTLKNGENKLRIEVTNSRANEMDQMGYPSGLLGPVTIQLMVDR